MENSPRLREYETSRFEEALSTSGILVSMLVIVFGIISLLDLWNRAITMAELSFALLMLIKALEYREKSRKKMLLCLGAVGAVLLFWIFIV